MRIKKKVIVLERGCWQHHMSNDYNWEPLNGRFCVGLETPVCERVGAIFATIRKHRVSFSSGVCDAALGIRQLLFSSPSRAALRAGRHRIFLTRDLYRHLRRRKRFPTNEGDERYSSEMKVDDISWARSLVATFVRRINWRYHSYILFAKQCFVR